MGRKSLAPRRRAEIVAALERCVLRDGLHRTTLEAVARELGVRRGLLSHYFGTREALLAALFERVLERRRREFEDHVAGREGEKRLAAGLDYLFGGPFDRDHHGLASSGEMLVLAARDTAYARELRGMYEAFRDLVAAELRRAVPGATPAASRRTAYGIVCLAEQDQTFGWLGFAPRHHAHARAAAERLVAGLRADAEARRRAGAGEGGR